MLTSARLSEAENLKSCLKTIGMACDYDRCSQHTENDAQEFYQRLDAVPGC
jgi:hypothetical protein